MDLREKLILDQKVKYGEESICPKCFHHGICRGENNQPCFECNRFVDANGVTVQEWIPVTERLPETNGYHVWVIACVDGKRSCVRMFERKMVRGKVVERFKYPWDTISDENITHWCEMPEPPKGD